MKLYKWLILFCAWVFWEQRSLVNLAQSERWDIEAAFETKEACEERIKLQPKREEKIRAEMRGKVNEVALANLIPIRVICLPSNVDPRPRN